MCPSVGSGVRKDSFLLKNLKEKSYDAAVVTETSIIKKKIRLYSTGTVRKEIKCSRETEMLLYTRISS